MDVILSSTVLVALIGAMVGMLKIYDKSRQESQAAILAVKEQVDQDNERLREEQKAQRGEMAELRRDNAEQRRENADLRSDVQSLLRHVEVLEAHIHAGSPPPPPVRPGLFDALLGVKEKTP